MNCKLFLWGLPNCSEQLIPKWLRLNEIVATGRPAKAVNQERVGGDFFHKFNDERTEPLVGLLFAVNMLVNSDNEEEGLPQKTE